MRSNRMMMAAEYEGIGLLPVVPKGLIIPFNGASAPAGFERVSAADGRHIVGAGSTYAAKSIGGAECSISRVSSTNGAHTGDVIGFDYEGTYFNPGSTLGSTTEAGDHSHTISAKYNRSYQQLLLIKALAYQSSYPANAIVLSKSADAPLAGLSICYDSNLILRAGATLTTGGGLSSQACSYDGVHEHDYGTNAWCDTTPPLNASLNTYAGSHTHPVTMAVANEELKRTYLTAWTKTSAFLGATGMIAMWEGVSPPAGWYLCDGNNGTLDLRDYFIILSSAANAGHQDNETNRIYVTASLDSVSWIHTHCGINKQSYPTPTNGPHGAFTGTHAHTSVAAWHSYTPPYYALTFVQKI